MGFFSSREPPNTEENCKKIMQLFKVQMKGFFIAEFERTARIRKITVYGFLMSLIVPEL